MNSGNATQIYFVDASNLSHPVNGGFQNAPARRRIKKNTTQPIIDVIVVLVALPALTILALLLEANTRGNWMATSQSRYTVLGLGLALAIVCIALTMYITSRVGGKMWSGAIPSDGSGPHFSYYGSRSSAVDLNDLPPSYEVVMGFDIPPPPYHAIIIESDAKDASIIEDCPKYIAIQHI